VIIVELNVRTNNEEGLFAWNALGYRIKKIIPGKNADKLIMKKK